MIDSSITPSSFCAILSSYFRFLSVRTSLAWLSSPVRCPILACLFRTPNELGSVGQVVSAALSERKVAGSQRYRSATFHTRPCRKAVFADTFTSTTKDESYLSLNLGR